MDNSIIKRKFLKKYHQQGANLNNPDQNIEFLFGENNNYHQIDNTYLLYDITICKADNTNFIEEAIRFVYSPFVYTFKEAPLATTGASDLEKNKYVGQISTIMIIILSKDDDLLSCSAIN